MKRNVCLLLCVALAFALACPALGADILTPQEAGQRMREIGIFHGNDSGDLMLDKGLTRAELATILARLDDPKGEFSAYPQGFAYMCAFTDVPDWAKSPVGYSWNRGLVKGYGNGLFGAADMVTPDAACTVILRLYGHKTGEGDIWDYNTAGAYAVGLGLIPAEAIQGTAVSRGNMAVLICNAMDGKTDASPQEIPTAVTTDHSQQANPAIFTGTLTRGVYNAFRDAVLHRDDILAGTFQPRSMGTSEEVDTATALRLVRRISGADIDYSVVDAIDGSAEYLTAKRDNEYDAAISHVQPFIERISQLPQREQVREMVWYIADRMTYNVKIKNLPSEILAQDDIMWDAGNCSTYSSALQFLCDQAGIPCILIDSDIHQWNAVYLDGAWWQVDPTANKGNIQTMVFQEYVNGVETEVQKPEEERAAILQDTRDNLTVFYQELDGDNYMDEQPEITQFLKEVLVPGSTK